MESIIKLKNMEYKKSEYVVLKHIDFTLYKGDFLCIIGKTGSGKTHCFLIPLAEKIKVEDNNLQALILLPTRELAIQTYQRCKEFLASFNVNIAILTGGNDTERLS